MKKKVHIQEIIETLSMVNDEMRAFLNLKTGEVFIVLDYDLQAAEEEDYDNPENNTPEWQQETLRIARDILTTDDYKELPSQFDIHEYSIMREFCYDVEDPTIRASLLRGISGRGAFRYFKNTVNDHGIQDAWFEYRDRAFRRIAIDWLEKHDIPYDETPRKTSASG